MLTFKQYFSLNRGKSKGQAGKRKVNQITNKRKLPTDLNTQWRSIYNKHRTWLLGVHEISMMETDLWAFVSQRFLWRKVFWEGFRYYVMVLSEWKRNHLCCAILDIPARKIRLKRSLCRELKHTFKARITELNFEAIETNRDLEKLLNFELQCGLFVTQFIFSKQNTL